MPSVTAALSSKAPYFTTGKTAPTKNNGGTFFYGGTIANSNNSSMGITYLGFRSGFSDNRPFLGATSANYGVIAGFSAGTFCYNMVRGKFIMLTYTDQLSGVANTVLRFPAAFNQKGGQNSWVGYFRTPQYIMGGGWDYSTGMPRARANLGFPMPTTLDPSVYPSTAPEQYPGTRAIPGRMFFIAAGLAKDGTPFAGSYKARTD